MKVAAAAVLIIAGTASGQSSRAFVHTDASGIQTLKEVSALAQTGTAHPNAQEDLLWEYVDAVSIPDSVALGDHGAESWVGHNLNDERMSKFTTNGSNVPDFMYSVVKDNPGVVGVAAASEASRCAMITQADDGSITLRWFSDAGGDTPLATYTFDPQFTATARRSVAVSADGSRVVACAFDGTNTELFLFDGDGNQLNSMTIAGAALSIDMDDAGNRLVATAGAEGIIIDTTTMTEEHAFSVSGAGGYFRISGDGSAVAGGGFNVRAVHDVGGTWQDAYTGFGSQDWFGAVSLSGDGDTLFAVSHNYGDGYLTNKHRIVDLTDGSVVADESFTGSGSFQNSVVVSEVNDDGTVFVAASWGDQANTEPEVRIYNRTLEMIDFVDTDGSPYALDMSSDGSYILVGSKSVHANTFGNGGSVTAFELESDDCLADTNGDGTVTPADFTAWINAYNNDLPECDQNSDDACTPADFTAWINNFNAGC